MIVRIVKLRFRESEIPTFLANFEKQKHQIRSSQGCTFLELYRDLNDPNVFFTYSHWRAPEDLENYRNSQFFKGVWSTTKKMFAGKPEAWSVDKVESLP